MARGGGVWGVGGWLAVAGCAGPAPSAGPGNVLVLLTDDHGTDKVGAYAEHPDPPPTPRMDGLASEGVLFRNAWAAPTCSPTRAALLTGRLGRRTGVGDAVQFQSGKELPLRETSLPALLASGSAPYATAAVGKWHLSAYNSTSAVDHPNLLGFQTFLGSMANLYDADVPDGQAHSYFHWEKITDGDVRKTDDYATTVTVDDALEQIATLPEPWFVYVAFNAPHRPLDPPPEHLHTQGALTPDSPEGMRYRAVVEALDTEIGRLLDEMDPEVRERTTVLLAGDNGTPSHAILEPWDRSRGKQTPFEGGINVPLIVAGPDVQTPGSESAALVHVMDVFSTALDIAGIEAPEGLVLDSESLRPYLQDPAAPGREVLFTERFVPVGPPPYNIDWRMTRDDRFKIIDRDGEVGVFDLMGRHDDGELLDLDVLESEQRAQVDALLTVHASFWSSVQGPAPF
ncbi:MAG: sulfatase-like hydrolase/transferase [Myxococcales bacterium]|nr:sulfatase-like hydrolase/transferase [Myxococcales bacterium]